MRTAAILLASLFVLGFAPVAAAADEPDNGTCSAQGIVCAGANVGADIRCSTSATGLATCSWTYGWFTSAFSNLLLPGSESHDLGANLTICAPGAGCATTREAHAASCSWLPAAECQDSRLGDQSGASTSAQLAFGQCLAVRIDLTATIAATSGVAGQPLGSVAFRNANPDFASGMSCYEDNGR